MRYVALLRGINVGGKTKVEMPRLKEAFERLGFKEVRTYINSGNVIFREIKPASQIKPLIEQELAAEFGSDIAVVVRDEVNIKKLAKEIPPSWTNDKLQKTDVLFLWDDIDSKDILEQVVIKPEIENVIYLPGALVWNIGRENVVRGGAVKLIKTTLYKSMTVRNINTVRKLAQLMK